MKDQVFHDATVPEVVFNDAIHGIRCDAVIPDAVRLHTHDWSAATSAQAIDPGSLHTIRTWRKCAGALQLGRDLL